MIENTAATTSLTTPEQDKANFLAKLNESLGRLNAGEFTGQLISAVNFYRGSYDYVHDAGTTTAAQDEVNFRSKHQSAIDIIESGEFDDQPISGVNLYRKGFYFSNLAN